MHRRAFLAATSAAALAARPNAPAAASSDDGQFGAVLDAAQVRGAPNFVSPAVLDGTALAVDDAFAAGTKRVLLDNVPPIMRQGAGTHLGSPGSCEACSYGYGLGGYTAGRTANGARAGWDASDPANAPSAAWLYQWAHESGGNAHACPKGSKALTYLRRLLRSGSPSTAQVPYNPNSSTSVTELCEYFELIDLGSTFPSMERFIIGSFKAIEVRRDGQRTQVPLFEELLRNRHAIAFSGLVPHGYSSPELDGDVYRAPRGFIEHSGHGQVIVGYDESLEAFLVQNSMGSDWNGGSASDPGRNGRIWYSYDAFFAGQKTAAIVFPRPSGDELGPSLASDVPDVPRLSLPNAIAHNTSEYSRLIVVLRASDLLNITSISAVDPRSKTRFELRLDQLMRLGYNYMERHAGTFAAGVPYEFTISARVDRSRVVYRGTVTTA
jgi:hypothetical protein